MSDGPTSDGEETEAGDAEAAPPAAPTMYDVPVTEAFGQVVLHPTLEQYVDTITALQADGYVSVIDLCGADYLTNPTRSLPAAIAPERFEIVVNLIAHVPPRRIRLRVQVPESAPVVCVPNHLQAPSISCKDTKSLANTPEQS